MINKETAAKIYYCIECNKYYDYFLYEEFICEDCGCRVDELPENDDEQFDNCKL